MGKIILLVALVLLPCGAGAQSSATPSSETSRSDQPGATSSQATGNRNSTSSRNTPTTGEMTGRNNPWVSRAPDNAPSRGTPQQ